MIPDVVPNPTQYFMQGGLQAIAKTENYAIGNFYSLAFVFFVFFILGLIWFRHKLTGKYTIRVT